MPRSTALRAWYRAELRGRRCVRRARAVLPALMLRRASQARKASSLYARSALRQGRGVPVQVSTKAQA